MSAVDIINVCVELIHNVAVTIHEWIELMRFNNSFSRHILQNAENFNKKIC